MGGKDVGPSHRPWARAYDPGSGGVRAMWIRSVAPSTLALVGLLFVGAAGAGEDRESEALVRRLRETKVTSRVENAAFAKVVDLLRVQTGLNIVIDPRIASHIGEIPVTNLIVDDIELETVLNLLQGVAGEYVVWTLRGDVVFFTLRELAATPLDARIYPVASLTARRTAFVPPPTGLLGRGPGARGPDDVRPFGSVDELMELVKNSVEPMFWEETEGADLRALSEDRIVVKATDAVHTGLLRFLAQLEDRGPDAIRVEVHALDSAKLSADVLRAGGDAGLTDEAAAALLAGEAAGPALCLAVREGMPSTAYAGSSRAYVAAYEARFAGGRATQDPRVETQELGLAVRVHAVGGGGDGRILLKLGVAITEARASGTSGPSDAPAIDLPARVIVERKSTLLLRPGRWHLAEGRTGGADAGRRAFLVRATPWEFPQAAPASATPLRVPPPVPAGSTASPVDVRVNRVQWECADLDQVVSSLRAISGLAFYISPRVRAEVYEEIEISLHLEDISLRTVLDLVTAPFELTWSCKDGLVVIDRRTDRGPRMALRYFDLKDLAVGIAPHARVVPGSRETTNPNPNRGRPTAAVPPYREEALVDLIRETIGTEETWEDPAAIEVRNSILIARNEPEILDAIQRLLDGLRAAVDVVVTTVDHVELDDDTARSLFAAEPGGGCPLLLDAAACQALEAAVTRGAARRLGRERIISVEGSGAPLTTGEEIRYVADYDVRVSDTGDASTPVRRVETLQAGATIGLRILPGHPGSHVVLEIVFERSVLSALTPFATPHGSIDLPETDVWRVATGLRIPDGRTAVVSASRTGKRMRLLLVTPRRGALDD